MSPNITKEELEWRKFELEQKVQLEELEFKRKELELKVQEQKSKQFLSPVLLTIVGGMITILTGLILKYYENTMTIQMEDRKFQSSLLLKAVESKNYNEFSDMILAFQENGLLTLDSNSIRNFRKKRFISTSLAISQGTDTILGAKTGAPPAGPAKIPCPPNCGQPISTPILSTNGWIIVASADKTLSGAKFEVDKVRKKGLGEAGIWLKDGYYRTCLSKYSSYDEALADLFEIKETVNRTAYLVRSDKWCPSAERDSSDKTYKIFKCL